MLGDLEGEEGGVARVAGGDGEASEPREGTLGSAAVKEAMPRMSEISSSASASGRACGTSFARFGPD